MSNEHFPRRLLVVNPNMSSGVTDAFVKQARIVAPAGTVIDGVTGTFGATIVSIEAENIIASHAALELLAKHGMDYDAVILAISYDSGLDGAREIMPVPVVGITEAVLMAAFAVSSSMGVIVFGETSLPLYRRMVRKYGIEPNVVGWEVVEIASAQGYLAPEAQDDAVSASIRHLHERDGATSVVILGTAIVGMAERLQPRHDIPVFDSAVPSISAALSAIDTDPHPTRLARPLSSSTGISKELSELIVGRARFPAWRKQSPI